MLGYLRQHPELDFGTPEEVAEKVAAAHKRKSELYIELVEQGALPGRPGVKRLIEEALDAGWTVAVASTSATRSVEAVLTSVVGPDTRARMAGVWAGDIVPAKKPAPDIYLLTLKDWASPGRCRGRRGLGDRARRRRPRPVFGTSSRSAPSPEDPFPAAAVVVSDLGEPAAPAQLISGEDIRDAEGLISFESLQRIAQENA